VAEDKLHNTIKRHVIRLHYSKSEQTRRFALKVLFCVLLSAPVMQRPKLLLLLLLLLLVTYHTALLSCNAGIPKYTALGLYSYNLLPLSQPLV
jgi:hypothetical protein